MTGMITAAFLKDSSTINSRIFSLKKLKSAQTAMRQEKKYEKIEENFCFHSCSFAYAKTLTFQALPKGSPTKKVMRNPNLYPSEYMPTSESVEYLVIKNLSEK
jgi:hypothetical protein